MPTNNSENSTGEIRKIVISIVAVLFLINSYTLFSWGRAYYRAQVTTLKADSFESAIRSSTPYYPVPEFAKEFKENNPESSIFIVVDNHKDLTFFRVIIAYEFQPLTPKWFTSKEVRQASTVVDRMQKNDLLLTEAEITELDSEHFEVKKFPSLFIYKKI